MNKKLNLSIIIALLLTFPISTYAKSGMTTFSRKALGISFEYPSNWGKAKTKEEINLAYMFDAPDDLLKLLKKNGYSNKFIANFKKDSFDQLGFLKKSRQYDNYLGKHYNISFSNNQNITLDAYSKHYIDFNGYEGSRDINTTSYKGQEKIDGNSCKNNLLHSLWMVDNYYYSDCQFNNKIITALGTRTDTNFYDNEKGIIMGIANLPTNSQYSGLILESHINDVYHNNAGDIMKFLGTQGYGDSDKKIINTNKDKLVGSCETIYSSSVGSINTSNYVGKIIDDELINNFTNYIKTELSKINKLKESYIVAIVDKYKTDLENYKGKKFSDSYEENSDNYYFYIYQPQPSLLDSIKTEVDMQKTYDKLNSSDISCIDYKFNVKDNLDSFKKKYIKSKQLKEFQQLVKAIKIK